MSNQPNSTLNKTGFIGGAFGASLLLIVYTIGSFGNDNRLAFLLLFCLLAIITGHLFIWVYKNKLSAYVCIQLSIVNILIAYLLALFSMDYLGYLHAVAPNESHPRSSYFYLVIFPLVMLIVHFNYKKESNLNANNS